MSTTADEPEDRASVVRHEEELDVGTRAVQAGGVRVRKDVDVVNVERSLPRGVEDSDVEHLPAGPEDSGEIETFEDGSVSIPVFEEELVVTRRLKVRERIVVHKRTMTEQQTIRADLRRERVRVDADEGVLDDPDATRRTTERGANEGT